MKKIFIPLIILIAIFMMSFTVTAQTCITDNYTAEPISYSEMSDYLLSKQTLGRQYSVQEFYFPDSTTWRDYSAIFINHAVIPYSFIKISNEDSHNVTVTMDCFDSGSSATRCTRNEFYLDNSSGLPDTNIRFFLMRNLFEQSKSSYNETDEIFCQFKLNQTGYLKVTLYNWYLIPTDSFSLFFGSSKFCQADYIENDYCYNMTELTATCNAQTPTGLEGFLKGYSGMIEVNGMIWLIVISLIQLAVYVFLFIILPIAIIFWIKKQVEKLLGRR
jgi:hypothetical protein